MGVSKKITNKKIQQIIRNCMQILCFMFQIDNHENKFAFIIVIRYIRNLYFINDCGARL